MAFWTQKSEPFRIRFLKLESRKRLDQAGFLQSLVSPVLIDGLEGLGGCLDPDILVQLRNPDTLGVEVRGNLTLHRLGDVTADAALFLGQTGTVDFTSNTNFGTAAAAYSCHRAKHLVGGRNREISARVKRFLWISRPFSPLFYPMESGHPISDVVF